jgi:hypothetical protein
MPLPALVGVDEDIGVSDHEKAMCVNERRIHGKRRIFALSVGPGIAIVLLSGTAAVRLAGANAHFTGAVPRAVTYREKALLDRAEELLTRDCMLRNGFEYWLTRPISPPVVNHSPMSLTMLDGRVSMVMEVVFRRWPPRPAAPIRTCATSMGCRPDAGPRI